MSGRALAKLSTLIDALARDHSPDAPAGILNIAANAVRLQLHTLSFKKAALQCGQLIRRKALHCHFPLSKNLFRCRATIDRLSLRKVLYDSTVRYFSSVGMHCDANAASPDFSIIDGK